MKDKASDRKASGGSKPFSRADPAPVAGPWRKHYARLLELRQRLIDDAAGLSSETAGSAPPTVTHPADAGTDSFDRDLAFTLLAFEHNALNEIDRALQRIEDGCYGICEITGEPIPRQRLEAIPWTRYTAQAQAELERSIKTSAAHLNVRGAMGPGDWDAK